MFILKKGHQPGVYVPLRALFLVLYVLFSLKKAPYYHKILISDLIVHGQQKK